MLEAKWKRLLAVAVMVVALPMSLAAACPSRDEAAGVEVEDCDAEDFKNRETDCGFAPTPKVTPTAGKGATPKTTKRRAARLSSG